MPRWRPDIWFQEIVDAQTQYATIPMADRSANWCQEDEADEYWGFFSEWRDELKDRLYDIFFPPERG